PQSPVSALPPTRCCQRYASNAIARTRATKRSSARLPRKKTAPRQRLAPSQQN
ncbi:hypothetical protein IWW39_002500, partial [Coemansia spiralis]